MGKENLNYSGKLQSVKLAGGYSVKSDVELEVEDFGLVTGDDLQVKNPAGELVFAHVRAFMPLNDKMNLVRLDDKVWMLVYTNKEKKVKLSRVNLHLKDGHCFLFDERGKKHVDQVSPYYRDIVAY